MQKEDKTDEIREASKGTSAPQIGICTTDSHGSTNGTRRLLTSTRATPPEMPGRMPVAFWRALSRYCWLAGIAAVLLLEDMVFCYWKYVSREVMAEYEDEELALAKYNLLILRGYRTLESASLEGFRQQVSNCALIGAVGAAYNCLDDNCRGTLSLPR